MVERNLNPFVDMAAPTYPHDIPSLSQTIPALPAVLGNLDLNRPIVAGTPIDPAHLTDAKIVVRRLKARRGKSPKAR